MRLGNRIICELCQEKKKQKKKYYIQIKHAEKKDCWNNLSFIITEILELYIKLHILPPFNFFKLDVVLYILLKFVIFFRQKMYESQQNITLNGWNVSR